MRQPSLSRSASTKVTVCSLPARMASSSEVHAPNIIGKLPALPHAPPSS
jgi:hypothetical protein